MIAICLFVSIAYITQQAKSLNYLTVFDNKKSRIFTCIILFLALLPKDMSQIRWLEDVIYKYGTLIISFVLLTIVLISANIKYVIKHKHNSLEVNLQK